MILIVTIGVLLMLVGATAYAGLWRWWTGRGRDRTTMFGAFWIGVGFVLIGLAPLFASGSTARSVATPLGAVVVVIGMLGAWWTPLALTPRWFRAQAPHSSRSRRSPGR